MSKMETYIYTFPIIVCPKGKHSLYLPIYFLQSATVHVSGHPWSQFLKLMNSVTFYGCLFKRKKSSVPTILMTCCLGE